MKGNYRDFLKALGYRESGGVYKIENKYGYLGKYQMGEAALKDAGYYLGDITRRRNDWIGRWTGKDGVWSKQDFLNNPKAQENAIKEFHKKMWKYIKVLDLDKYVGKKVRRILITESGLLGGAHLLGAGNLKKFLRSNGRIVPTDGFGTPITHYIEKFGGYDISEITGKRSIYVPSQKQKPDPNDFVWDFGPSDYSTDEADNSFYDNIEVEENNKATFSKSRSIWDIFF